MEKNALPRALLDYFFPLLLTPAGDPNSAGLTAARLPCKQTHPPYLGEGIIKHTFW